MSFRLVEIVLPKASCGGVRNALRELEFLGCWEHELGSERGLVRLFVRTENTEAILDALQKNYGSQDGFRILLLPIEATIPPIETLETPVEARGQGAGEENRLKEAGRISREELLEDLAGGTHVTGVFIATALLSTIVAAVGLLRNNVAVIIGAMVIAPLLTPNMALALATTLGDVSLARRSLWTNLVGGAAAGILAVLVGLFVPFDPTSHEIATRCHVSLADIVLALAAGVAGALACTTGVSAGLIGVMVAVALMPPLVAAGLLLGAGEWLPAWGAFLLLATNVICVNLAGVATFLVQGIRPRTWWEADRAKRATLIALASWIALLLILGVLVALARH